LPSSSFLPVFLLIQIGVLIAAALRLSKHSHRPFQRGGGNANPLYEKARTLFQFLRWWLPRLLRRRPHR